MRAGRCGHAVTAPAPGAMVGLDVERALRALLFLDQRLPVGDRDLIIVGMDFAEGEEAVAVAAIIDERRLQRRFDARDFGEIDVAAKLFTLRRLEVEFLDTVAAQDNHPGFLRMGRVDEHFVGHWRISWRQAGSLAPVETGLHSAASAAYLILGGRIRAGPGLGGAGHPRGDRTSM